MYCIHLHQIFYSPAYFDSNVDYLAEPAFKPEKSLQSLSAKSDDVQEFLQNTRAEYISHIKGKLISLLQWSAQKEADLVVFPEYSVPPEVLGDMQETASASGVTVIAGSHRVLGGEVFRTLYEKLGAAEEDFPVGHACCPILLPDGGVRSCIKQHKSQWEQDLKVERGREGHIAIETEAGQLDVSTLLCIDSLHPETFGKLWSDRMSPPHLVVCPSMSPRSDVFEALKAVAAANGALFLYVNTAAYGSTLVGFPDSLNDMLVGPKFAPPGLKQGIEAVLEFAVEPSTLLRKQRAIGSQPVGRNPVVYPICSADCSWLEALDETREQVVAELENDNPEEAAEWLDLLLTEHAPHVPLSLKTKLEHIRHSTLRLWSGDPTDVVSGMSVATVGPNLSRTEEFWGGRARAALDLVLETIRDPESGDDPLVYELLPCLKQMLRELPMMEAVAPKVPTKAETPDEGFYFGEDELLSSFQDRGPTFDTIEDFIRSEECKVVVVTGGMGIGKTDLLNVFFRKIFRDWRVFRVDIPSEATTARVVAQVASLLGMDLDINSLSLSTHKVFQQRVRGVIETFYSQPKRALVLDDLSSLLGERNPREYRQVDLLLQEAAAPKKFSGGRIFAISSSYLPRKWLNRPGVRHLHLGRLHDLHTHRIVAHQMRKVGAQIGEIPPDIPQKVLDLLQGHPLSALFCAETIAQSGKIAVDSAVMEALGVRLAEELLSRVTLSNEESALLRRLSVFRLPIRLNRLETVGFDGEQLLELSRRCVLSSDGESISMHEATRRHFYRLIGSDSERHQYHNAAVSYYEPIFLYAKRRDQWRPTIAAELCHHLAKAGRVKEARAYGIGVIEEMKTIARRLYREHRDYPEEALKLYRLLAEMAPDDPQIHAYIGRCYGRLNRWLDSDESFERALAAALQNRSETWWIHRDWGHIRSRFGYHEEAEKHFSTAEETHPDDASIIANRAFIRWREGDIPAARTLYERAYRADPNHEYTLTYYIKFLEDTGDSEFANALRKERKALQVRLEYKEPQEFPFEEEYFDL